jgi:hypothetical protein
MNQEKYRRELIDLMQEALAYADNDPSRASDYLNGKKEPGFLASKERKEAFSRARKVLSETRDRPTWFVLKCLGLNEDDLAQA